MISIGRPTAYPESAPPGPVLLTIPITSTEGLWATVRVLVYEGSFLPGHGTLLWYQDQTLFLTGTISIQFMRSASVLGTIDRRDVRVQVFDQNAQLVADEEWDDIYYVRETEEPELKVLRFEILGEEQGGSINFNPPPLDAEGHYEKGTVVSLTAIVNAGFVFVRWHGDVNEPVTSLTNSITMDENHTIRAEFAFAEVEALWPLEVDITPAEGGYVTTSPPPVDITNHFTNGTVGKFIEDTRVKVIAHPNAGYEFGNGQMRYRVA
ncbi:hypothetical protein LCGC14_0655090 [marine sediment metagenome]|uniref:Bacterial repeat domain-containing protein n=1 Tax=marine sediment metagenome TaxID=412755 RepID=A0A0F9RF69_9ZZZZ